MLLIHRLFSFFDILEKIFISIDSCNKKHGYQVGFPANRSPKMAKNAFICMLRNGKVIKSRSFLHMSAVYKRTNRIFLKLNIVSFLYCESKSKIKVLDYQVGFGGEDRYM